MKNFIWVLLSIVGFNSQATNVLCGHVFDAERGKMQTQQVLTMSDGLIESVADFDSQIIDLDFSKRYCLPGLIDAHTHLASEMGPGSYMYKYTLNAPDVTLNAVKHGQLTLQAGFTTVRDLGDSFGVTVALREAIKAGKVTGPRIYTSGESLATTGGHADPSNGYRDGLISPPTADDGVINSASEARRAVRKHYQDGTDLIKITATGGVLSQAASSDNSQFTDEELQAIIATANDYGFKVAAHAHGKQGMIRAIKAGVSSIEHGSYLDDEVIKLMKKHGTYLVPTLMAGAFVTEKAQIDGYFPPMVKKKAATIGPIIASAFNRAYLAGVKIAFGTDTGVSAHGQNAEEFALMVANGMSPAEALMAATIKAADLIGEQKLGQLKAGFYADMVVTTENPLENINTLLTIPVVIKNGQVIKNEYQNE